MKSISIFSILLIFLIQHPFSVLYLLKRIGIYRMHISMHILIYLLKRLGQIWGSNLGQSLRQKCGQNCWSKCGQIVVKVRSNDQIPISHYVPHFSLCPSFLVSGYWSIGETCQEIEGGRKRAVVLVDGLTERSIKGVIKLK